MKVLKTTVYTISFFWLVPSFASTLATVNGTQLTKKNIEQALNGLTPGQQETLLRDPTSRMNALNGAVDQELLFQEAKKLKLSDDPEFKEMTKNFEKQALASVLLQRKWMAKLTPAAVQHYYQSHIGLFSTDRVHIQHILASTEQEAQKYLALAKAPGADFRKLAEEFSKAPEAKNDRGDIGFITRERFVPEFTTPVFAAPESAILGPIHTLYGYHVVKIVEKKAGKPLEFAEVEMRARELLRAELTKEYTSALRKQARIEINQQALNKL